MMLITTAIVETRLTIPFFRRLSIGRDFFSYSHSQQPFSRVWRQRQRRAPHIQSAAVSTMAPRSSISEFQELVGSSTRILALCGAGLSAASGLPTFRGAGGLWRNHEATSLASPDAFRDDPALVWLFYAWRRHMALKAKPNRAHYALAELARKKEDFLCLTQNVDGKFAPRA